MIIIQIAPEDLLETRFAYSPLVELTLSRRLFHVKPFKHSMGRWVEDARQAMNNIELPYMDTLIKYRGYIPDFLTPTPDQPENDIEAALAGLLRTPPHVVRLAMEESNLCPGKDLEDDEIIKQFMLYPQEALGCLAEEMRFYWQRVLAPQWHQVRAILDGDVLYRARQMALGGHDVVISDLHPSIHYDHDAGRITIHKEHRDWEMHLDIEGRGLQVVPAVFSASHFHWQVFEEYTPMLIYTPRGAGNLYATAPDPSPALEVLLGGGRASVLESLLTPLSTSELATRLHMTSGAISQHLSRLKEAGLVESQRSGRWVYYQLSDRGMQFVNLFAT